MPTSFRSRLLAQRALMHRLRQQQRRNPLQAGFTLIELLIVVIIIGILSSIAIPAFLNQQLKARAKAADTTAMSAARACAALQVTGEHATFSAPPGVTETTCAAAGKAQEYNTTTGAFPGIKTQAKAIISTDGSVTLTPAVAE